MADEEQTPYNGMREQKGPGQCARKKSGWIRMARRTRFAAWMMAALMVSSAASAQSDDAENEETPVEELAEDAAEVDGDLEDEDALDGDAVEDDVSVDAAAAPSSEDMASDYIAPDRTDEAGSPEIDEGLAAFEAGDFERASLIFYDVMVQSDYGTPLAQRGQYELMHTLAEMELLYGARLILDEIIDEGEAHPYFQDAASSMIAIARALPGDNEVLDRVSKFAGLFPDRIEPEYRDEFAYYLGEYYYGAGELDAAIDYLAAVSPDAELYPKARFLSAITHVRQYDAEGAAADLGVILQRVKDARGEERRELEHIGQLAQVTMARMFYSTGEYDKAIKYYANIGQDSKYWLDSLFESSWAYFQTDEYNRALGNLHSLNSPFFNDQYYPEAPILQAVIFFYNCQFDQVRLALDEFQYVYAPLKDELQITIDGFLDNEEAYEFLRDARENTGENQEFDPRLQQIVDAALGDEVLSSAMAFLDRLQSEVDYIEEAPDSWSRSELGDFLYGDTVGQLALSRESTGGLVISRLDTILTELETRNRESSAILVETDLAEANALSDEVAGELESEHLSSSEDRATSEQMIWRFDGEYWRDELGYYSYHIDSQCRDIEAN